jgi:hypothetical protein
MCNYYAITMRQTSSKHVHYAAEYTCMYGYIGEYVCIYAYTSEYASMNANTGK